MRQNQISTKINTREADKLKSDKYTYQDQTSKWGKIRLANKLKSEKYCKADSYLLLEGPGWLFGWCEGTQSENKKSKNRGRKKYKKRTSQTRKKGKVRQAKKSKLDKRTNENQRSKHIIKGKVNEAKSYLQLVMWGDGIRKEKSQTQGRKKVTQAKTTKSNKQTN